MREIKFNAWDIDRNIMITDAVRLENNVMVHRATIDESLNVIWLQYTGLKDKNGKEIWESDVLQISDSSFKYLVIYKRSSFVLEHLDIDLKGDAWGNLDRITDSDMQDFKLEVIGNIHENPELLKG